MQNVALPNYTITIGHKAQEGLNELVKSRSYPKVCVLVDTNTKKDCLPLFREQVDFDFTVIEVPEGEQNKTLDTCQSIWKALFDAGCNRKSLLINLGGGVIGDMGGFCASTFKRGIHFIQSPTTLLSQVDASIGGKLGIDFMDVKNSVGVFNDPQGVFINTQFFKTLPAEELRSGYAEVIKHALIWNEAEWARLQKISDLSTYSMAKP